MKYSLAVFQEPRGVMRIFQLVFAIVAFATTTNFSVDVQFNNCPEATSKVSISYPFRFQETVCKNESHSFQLTANVSSDSQFYVATGVLSLLYCIFIVGVYTCFDELYKSKSEIPLADFMLTTILAIFWLSGSSAWANGTSALKLVTDADTLKADCQMANCSVSTSSFSSLNISLIIGFLNFFLWASDLWFLYKETIWFQGRQTNHADGTPTV